MRAGDRTAGWAQASPGQDAVCSQDRALTRRDSTAKPCEGEGTMATRFKGSSCFYDPLPSEEQELEASVFSVALETKTEPRDGMTRSRTWLSP